MSGYIKLYRSLLEWDWFQDANTFRIFIYCLLKANRELKKWQGIEIKPGQFITSYEKIATDLNIGVQSVRTSIKKLNLTGELTNKTTSRYSMITVKNWGRYQETNKQTNNQLTINQQTTNNQLTTNKNQENQKNQENKEEDDDVVRESFLKNWYGEYQNVFLTDEQLNKLKSFIFDEDFLFFLIDELSSNIAVGKSPQFDESQPWGHYAMVKRYWKFRMQNPQKFKKNAQSESQKTSDIVAKVRARMEAEENET